MNFFYIVPASVQRADAPPKGSRLRDRSQRLAVSSVPFPLLLLALVLSLPSTRAAAVTCTVSASNVSFGNYTGAVISPGGSAINVNCASGTAYAINLNAGQSTAGTEYIRQMTNGSVTLNYALYQDAAHTLNWGNTSATGYVSNTGTGASQANYVYPQLTAGQTVAPGTYTDTMTATLAHNGSGSTTFTVTATIVANCTISAASLAFGAYVPATQLTANSTITVNCTNTTPYQVGISYGVANQPQNRYMTTQGASNCTNFSPLCLQYFLYQDAAHTQAWGVPYYGTEFTGAGTGLDQALTVYGMIYGGQYGTPGAYTDTIIATVTY